MPKFTLHYQVNAPAERAFDLSRSIDFHQTSTAHTGEQAIGGRTSGLIEMNETVTWRAKHFGIWQTLTSRISVFDYPQHFQDEQVRGAFKYFKHDHYFNEEDGKTHITEHFEYQAPLPILGPLAETLFLTGYMKAFLKRRGDHIVSALENGTWQKYLPDSHDDGISR